MGLLIQNGDTIGGISSELVDKIGKVVQTPSNSNNEFYELLFSKTADNTERTEETRKCSSLQYNPNKSAITIGSRTPNSNIGTYSVAMGILCTASGAYSHAESVQTTASGDYSHSEGLYTTASGVHSHSEGFNTTASGQGSHAEGYSTIANHRSQHVFGEYNIEDPSQKYGDEQGNYIEIVGNGTTNIIRSNARTLDWNGNEMLAGNLSLAGASSDISLTGTGNTWDGTNTSLKSALSGKAAKATTLAGYGITDAKIVNGVITLGSNSITPLTSHQDISGKVNKSGDTINGNLNIMTGNLTIAGSNIVLGTPSSSSNDSADLVWRYGNGNEKMRIWSANEYTGTSGPSFRVYKSDGTQLFEGTLSLSNHTHSYLPLSGGTLTGTLNVKPATGEAQVKATNTTTGKSIYLYSRDDGVVGIYNSAGTNLISMDNNKKLVLSGTDYSVSNPDKFRSAIGADLLYWKYLSKTGNTITPGGTTIKVGTFPAKTGYTRHIIQASSGSWNVNLVNFTLSSDNYAQVLAQSITGSNITNVTISCICVYLADSHRIT